MPASEREAESWYNLTGSSSSNFGRRILFVRRRGRSRLWLTIDGAVYSPPKPSSGAEPFIVHMLLDCPNQLSDVTEVLPDRVARMRLRFAGPADGGSHVATVPAPPH